jgi:hypothetical protein
MPQSEGRSGLLELFARAGRMLGEFPVVLVPSVIPAVWEFVAPRIGLIDPAAALSVGDVGFGAGAWKLLVYMLAFVMFLVLSQGVTVVLVRDAARGGSARLQDGFGEAFGRFAPLFAASFVGGLIISAASLVFVFPGLVATFFLWYIVQCVVIDGASAFAALRGSFRFSATYAGETFALILATLVVSFAFSFVPYVGWLLIIPATAYFTVVSTLLYLERET